MFSTVCYYYDDSFTFELRKDEKIESFTLFYAGGIYVRGF